MAAFFSTPEGQQLIITNGEKRRVGDSVQLPHLRNTVLRFRMPFRQKKRILGKNGVWPRPFPVLARSD